jgi:hypothetical protein
VQIKGENKRDGLGVQILAFVFYFIFFGIIFYILKHLQLLNTKCKYDYLLYALVFALFSFLIPLSMTVLRYFIKKRM